MKSSRRILLRANRRIGALAAVVCLVLGTVLLGPILDASARGAGVLAGVLLGVCLTVLLASWRYCWLPRLALTDDELLVYIRFLAAPYRLPLDAVEVFFIGQGPVSGAAPAQTETHTGAVAANVIVRIAESAKPWQSGTTNSWLAVWADGYITIRGLWCEDIHQDRLKVMNGALMEAKRRRRKMV